MGLTMSKFFVFHTVPPEAQTLLIEGENLRHIRDVLRMKAGETLTVCDSSGVDCLCEIVSFHESGVMSRILSRNRSDNEGLIEIVIYQGLPKAEKMETIIQKSVELGGARIVPVACARSVVRLGERKDIEKKIQRWSRIAEEAAKQCNRSRIPRVDPPISFKEAILQMKQADFAFVPWECETKTSIRSLLEQVRPSFKGENDIFNCTNEIVKSQKTESADKVFSKKENSIGESRQNKTVLAFLIGPEGGIDPEEIQLAKESGLPTVTLGKRILRTETVAPAVLAMILYETEL